MSTDMELDQLNRAVQGALVLWPMPRNPHAQLLNVSENVTYLVTADEGFRAILRVHRPGYNSRRSVESELAWLDALRSDAVIPTPRYFLGKDGSPVQSLQAHGATNRRLLALFHFIDGEMPSETGDLAALFEALGAMAARCHDHTLTWDRPPGFERLSWNCETVFGKKAMWGDWRDAPGVTPSVREVLEKVETQVRTRLDAYGSAPERFNLIHADMRLANLIVEGDRTSLIDFDDCGFGWLMYDFAAAISFIEDNPRIPELQECWVKGYRTVRNLAAADVAEIPTLIMFRRLALLAWIGSHAEAPEAQALVPRFAAVTKELGERWLESAV